MLDNRNDLTEAQFTYFLNQAYNHLSQPEVRWHRELETTFDITLVAGQSSYDVDDTTVGFTILDIVDVTFYDATTIAEDTTRYDVQPRDINWWNKQTLSSYGGGPRHYAWYADDLKFGYLPNSSDAGKQVRVSAYRAPADLSADSDVTVLNRYWDRGVVLGAKWMLELDLGYAEQAEASRQEYAGWLNEKKDATELGSKDTRQRTQIRHEPYMDRS
jgi:hypothetical protein